MELLIAVPLQTEELDDLVGGHLRCEAVPYRHGGSRRAVSSRFLYGAGNRAARHFIPSSAHTATAVDALIALLHHRCPIQNHDERAALNNDDVVIGREIQ